MSEQTGSRDQNGLDNMLAALHEELQKHRDVIERGGVRVAVEIPEALETARTSNIVKRAGDTRCGGGCPEGTKCKLDPFTLQWFCD